jgi:hypothetical protein
MDNFIVPQDIIKRKKKTKRTVLPEKIFFADDEEVPDKIIVYLSEKINLEQIDRAINYKFSKLKDDLENKEKLINVLETKLNKAVIESERKDLQIKIIREKEYFTLIRDDILLEKYKTESKELLDNYKESDKKLDKVIDFLDIAEKYINIEVIKKIEDNIKCNGCSLDLKEVGENFDGIYICPQCNCINNYIKPIKHVKDSEHYLMNTGDDDINNFIKVLSKFEGKNVSLIPDILYKKLDEYFINRDMEKGDFYKKKDNNNEGKKKGTSKKKMWAALEELGYNQYYDEINYITHVYWGWKLPDLTLFRDQIIKDYQITQQVWQRIKKDYKRSASLGTSFRLLSHLKAVNYPYCKREDFKIQDMVESLQLHNDAWRRMCEETGVKYYAIT